MRFLGLVLLAAGLAALVFPKELGAAVASVRSVGVNPPLYWARVLHEWSWPTALAGLVILALGQHSAARRARDRFRVTRRWKKVAPPEGFRCRSAVVAIPASDPRRLLERVPLS